MAAEVSISVDQLQEVVEHVQRTRKAQTIRVADGVVAVVKPEPKRTARKAPRRPSSLALPTTYTLESVFGSVPIPPHLNGRDIEDIIHEATEDHAERIMRE